MNKDENNLIEKRKDIRVYSDYVVLERQNTQPYLMISELIDNSISSFDNKFGENNWSDNVLKIEITLNYWNKEEGEINKIKYCPKNYIEVKDNAFGITKEKLIDSIILNKKLSSNSSMNVHGKGLKQSSFYFGLGMKVTSKVLEEGIFFVKNDPIKNGFDKEVEFEVEEQRSNEYFVHNKSGTIVKIFNLRKNKKISEKKLKTIIDSLSYRYGKMIKEEKLNIKLILINPNERKNFEVNEIVDDKASLKDEVEFNNSSEKENKEWEKRFDNKLEKLKNSTNENNNYVLYPDVFEKTAEELKKFLFVEDKNVDLEWKQIIKLGNREVEAKFWLLSNKASPEKKKIKATSKSRGIRIFQGERALLHPPVIKNENQSTYLLRDVIESGSVDNRFAGEINIIGFEDVIKTTSDKATINFDDANMEREFDDQLNLIYDIFVKFILIGRELERARGHMISTNDSVTANKIKNMLSPFVKELIIPNDVDDEGNAKKLNIKIELQNEYDVEVQIDNDTNPNDLIYLKKYNLDEINEETKKIEGKIFFNHPIWKELREKTDKMTKDSILSFYVVLVIQELKWKEKISKISKQNIDCEKKLERFEEDSSPNNTMNEIMKEIK